MKKNFTVFCVSVILTVMVFCLIPVETVEAMLPEFSFCFPCGFEWCADDKAFGAPCAFVQCKTNEDTNHYTYYCPEQ